MSGCLRNHDRFHSKSGVSCVNHVHNARFDSEFYSRPGCEILFSSVKHLVTPAVRARTLFYQFYKTILTFTV